MNRSQKIMAMCEASSMSVATVLMHIDNEKWDVLQKWIETASSSDIQAVMKKDGNVLYPSGWAWRIGTPYPGKLAQVLVKTSEKESTTDLMNPYYGGGKRKLTPEAEEVFMKDVLGTDVGKLMQELTAFEGYDEESFIENIEDMHPNGFQQWAKKKPDQFKKIMMKLPKSVHAAFEAAAKQ